MANDKNADIYFGYPDGHEREADEVMKDIADSVIAHAKITGKKVKSVSIELV